MLRTFNAHLKELESRAEKDGHFVDYQCLTATREYGAVMCTVSSKEGKRVCRMAGNGDISAAQEEAGYMALCVFYDENMRSDGKGSKPTPQNTGTQPAAHTDGTPAGQQTQARPAQTGQAGQQTQARPAQTGQAGQRNAAGAQQAQRPTGSTPVTPTARTQGRQTAADQASAGNRPAGQARPVNTPPATAPSQQRTPAANQQPAQKPAGPAAQNQQRMQAGNQAQANRRPVQTGAPAGERAADDFRVMIGNFKNTENNWISDLAAHPQTLKALRGIAGVINPADESMREPIQQVRQYMINHQLL